MTRIFAALVAGALLGAPTLNAQYAPEAKAPTGDLVETAVAAGSFKTLASALGAADLVATLKGPGPFTVFAPTDQAFAGLPPGTVDALLRDKAKLTAVLTYHVVPGRITAADLAAKADPEGYVSLTTVQGAALKVRIQGSKVLVGQQNARVTAADVAATNGVIHVIDAMILPPN